MFSALATSCGRSLRGSLRLVWIGLISYPLYLCLWPLLVFFEIIKFGPMTLLERGLIVGLSFLCAWLTFRFIESPFRFGRPDSLKASSLCAGLVLVAAIGGIIVEGGGLDFRLPPEIRGMTNVVTQSSKWRVPQCHVPLLLVM